MWTDCLNPVCESDLPPHAGMPHQLLEFPTLCSSWNLQGTLYLFVLMLIWQCQPWIRESYNSRVVKPFQCHLVPFPYKICMHSIVIISLLIKNILFIRLLNQYEMKSNLWSCFPKLIEPSTKCFIFSFSK